MELIEKYPEKPSVGGVYLEIEILLWKVEKHPEKRNWKWISCNQILRWNLLKNIQRNPGIGGLYL